MVDKTGEAWRHECEVRAVLLMPADRRSGYMEQVGKRRGLEAGQKLRTDVYHLWIANQVKALNGMDADERENRLWRIERGSNARTRADVEAAMTKCEMGA